MSLKKVLKDIWFTIVNSPSDPSPGVRQKLEEKGYKFHVETLGISAAMPGVSMMPITMVFNKAGEKVSYGRTDHPPSAEYRRDFDAALAAHKAEKGGPKAPGL